MADEDRSVTLDLQTRDSGLVVIELTGELDSYGTQEINPTFYDAVHSNRSNHILIDLSAVPYLSSAALAMFVVNAKSMQRAGGKLYVTGATKNVQDVFTRAGFEDIFPMYDSRDDAVETIEKKITT